jgi:acyl-CoA synthetase (AMP-forming)/AMP-acid ligase II/lysophospholipase L1-like esterase
MRIICFGDSLTSCGGQGGRYSDILQQRFPAHEFINKGSGGETFVDAVARVDDDVIALQPGLVVIEFGANDWWRDERPYTAWAKDLETLITRCQTARARVIVAGVFGEYLDSDDHRLPKGQGIDDRAVAFKDLEAKLAGTFGCGYIANMQERIVGQRRCWSDTNHPNEYGNRFVADTIEPVLAEMLGDKAEPVRKPNLLTVRDIWREAVELAPDARCVVEGKRRFTYKQADKIVRQVATGLSTTADIERPVVALYLPNCLEYFLVYWAVMELGGVIVPLNTFIKADALAAIFTNVQPDILVVRSASDTVPLKIAASAGTKLIVAIDGSPGFTAWSSIIASEPRPALAPGPTATDTAIIMHTSGTTGVPKGAVMRHDDLMFNVTATINAQGFEQGDIHLLVNPMFHPTALYSTLPSAPSQKASVVITADTTPTGLMQIVATEKITTFLSVPTIFQRIVTLPDIGSYDISSLRVLAYAGSAMPIQTIHQLQGLFPNVALHNFFGLTETISTTHVLDGEDATTRPDSIGRLQPFVDAIIVGDDLAKVQCGATGELLFARANVISTYINQPKRLAEALIDVDGQQWFRTGDLATVDADGFFFIKGRKKDMIIVGGENVYSAEVEAVLLAHPQIKESAVVAVAATGVRESLGELIRACVVIDGQLTAQDIRRHCNDRLASYQVPHEVVFLDDLPKNPAGKVLKGQLIDG